MDEDVRLLCQVGLYFQNSAVTLYSVCVVYFFRTSHIWKANNDILVSFVFNDLKASGKHLVITVMLSLEIRWMMELFINLLKLPLVPSEINDNLRESPKLLYLGVFGTLVIRLSSWSWKARIQSTFFLHFNCSVITSVSQWRIRSKRHHLHYEET